jgi:methionyl-tRNA synthetase
MTQQARQILVTSALLYANGDIHLGHMVEAIQTDIWVRWQKLQGADCYYISADDTHGTPIMLKAEQLGITPEELIAKFKQRHERDLADFAIGHDHYYTTHSDENRELATTFYERLQARGDIYTDEILQFFDPEKQMFLPDRYIKGNCPRCGADDQYGDNCESCGATYLPTELKNPISVISGATPVEKKSKHFFFDLPRYQDFLKTWVGEDHVQPEVAHKLDEWLEGGLQAWNISRDKPYFGFKIPGEKDKYFYVWLDAPMGYMASWQNYVSQHPTLSFDAFFGKDSTAELYHFIGKDIIYFHALFWPALLSGAGFRTPTKVVSHGFLTVDGQKMSKSRGTFIKARTYLNHLDPEYLRYYFAAKLSAGIDDIDLNFEDFRQRINSDLVGKFINIASRTARFIEKYFDGQLHASHHRPELFEHFVKTGDTIADCFNQHDYARGVRHIMELADEANQYIDELKPWQLIKDDSQQDTVQQVCTQGINLFRLLTLYLKPILPVTTEALEDFLNCEPLSWNNREQALLAHSIKPFKPLCQRIEKDKVMSLLDEAKKETAELAPADKPEVSDDGLITIDDFVKVDLRVARIAKADHVEGADKLLRLEVDLGELGTRQIFAGIKAYYQPEDLIDKLTVVAANLKPRKMRFGLSEGMVLAASHKGQSRAFILHPDSGAEPGMRIS